MLSCQDVVDLWAFDFSGHCVVQLVVDLLHNLLYSLLYNTSTTTRSKWSLSHYRSDRMRLERSTIFTRRAIRLDVQRSGAQRLLQYSTDNPDPSSVGCTCLIVFNVWYIYRFFLVCHLQYNAKRRPWLGRAPLRATLNIFTTFLKTLFRHCSNNTNNTQYKTKKRKERKTNTHTIKIKKQKSKKENTVDKIQKKTEKY